MDSQHILRIPRSGSPDGFVLVSVSRVGPSELDLKLVATEGEYPYIGSVKSSQLNSLRAPRYHCSDSEWTFILADILGQNRPSTTASEEWRSGLEAVASFKAPGDEDGNGEITLTIRRRVGAIAQSLGTITLKQDDDQAIQLFDWTGIALSRAHALGEQISSLTNKYRSAEDTIKRLNSQLEELIQAKNNHGDELIAKFVQLLNEKKLKIRNQQRLLATANVDLAKFAGLDTDNGGKGSRSCSANGRLKRKAEEELVAMSESEDGFDIMDICENHRPSNEPTTESDKQSTPGPSEGEAATDDEDGDELPDTEPTPPTSKPTRQAATTSTATKRSTAEPPSTPPPRRELPFTRRLNRSHKLDTTEKHPFQSDPKISGNKGDADDETDDDEL